MVVAQLRATLSYFFCYLERHAKIQNNRKTPSGRKERGRKKEKRKNIAKFSGHYVRPRMHNVHAHALRSHQFLMQILIPL